MYLYESFGVRVVGLRRLTSSKIRYTKVKGINKSVRRIKNTIIYGGIYRKLKMLPVYWKMAHGFHKYDLIFLN